MNTIKRSTGLRPKINGLPVATCLLPGGGFCGATRALDRAVERAAEMLRDHYKCDIEIRFNSHRKSGGAYINGPDWTCAGINAGQSSGKGRIHYACNVSERFLKDKSDTTDKSSLTEGEGYAYRNPPFEKRADEAHIRHAIRFLKPGGRLVAVACSTTGARLENEFDTEPLPAGSFARSDRPTAVSACLIMFRAEQ